MPEWLYEYRNVFSKNKSERIPIRKLYDHTIDFVEDIDILGDLICIQLVIVYLDDILIFGTCLEEHR